MKPIGQINRGTTLGEYIYNLTKNPSVINIVDIGTWNGMGTSKCIYDGVVDSNDKKFVISLECDMIHHQEAKINLGILPQNFNLIHGTIVTVEELIPISENLSYWLTERGINNDQLETFRGYLNADLVWLRQTPYVMNIIPKKY